MLCSAESAVRDRIGKGHNPDIAPLSGIVAKLKAQQAALAAKCAQLVFHLQTCCVILLVSRSRTQYATKAFLAAGMRMQVGSLVGETKGTQPAEEGASTPAGGGTGRAGAWCRRRAAHPVGRGGVARRRPVCGHRSAQAPGHGRHAGLAAVRNSSRVTLCMSITMQIAEMETAACARR